MDSSVRFLKGNIRYRMVIKDWEYYIIETTKITRGLTLLVSGLLFIVGHLYSRSFLSNRFPKEVNLTQLEPVRIKIKPKSIRQYHIIMGLILFFDIFILLFILFYIQDSNLGFLIGFLVFFPLRLLMFTLLIGNPAIEEKSIYRITLVD